MTEPTEYPVDLPVTPKLADRMRAAGWAPVVETIATERARIMDEIESSADLVTSYDEGADESESGFACADVRRVVGE